MKTKTTTDVLNQAADLIEKGWTQKTLARNKQDQGCSPNNKNAVAWCVMGALLRVTDRSITYFTALNTLRGQMELGTSINSWNDHPKRTQAEVVTALRAAARKAEE